MKPQWVSLANRSSCPHADPLLIETRICPRAPSPCRIPPRQRRGETLQDTHARGRAAARARGTSEDNLSVSTPIQDGEMLPIRTRATQRTTYHVVKGVGRRSPTAEDDSDRPRRTRGGEETALRGAHHVAVRAHEGKTSLRRFLAPQLTLSRRDRPFARSCPGPACPPLRWTPDAHPSPRTTNEARRRGNLCWYATRSVLNPKPHLALSNMLHSMYQAPQPSCLDVEATSNLLYCSA